MPPRVLASGPKPCGATNTGWTSNKCQGFKEYQNPSMTVRSFSFTCELKLTHKTYILSYNVIFSLDTFFFNFLLKERL